MRTSYNNPSVIFEGSRLFSMWACQRINPCMHVYLLTQWELDQEFPHDAALGPFIAPVHMPCDVTNDVIA